MSRAINSRVATVALPGQMFELSEIGTSSNDWIFLGFLAAFFVKSPILPFQPPTGLSLSVASFNIVIIGGMGSLPGAFLGGLIVSVAESLGAVFLSPSMKELVSFSLLIVILLFRPAGLFGRPAS